MTAAPFGPSQLAGRLDAEESVRTVRVALADVGESAWIVGGTIRDALLGRPVRDVDLAVAGDAAPVARAVSSAAGGPAFSLSEEFGAWRAMDRSRSWVCDVSPLQGTTIEEDLARRDFTVNAMAVPLRGGELRDPLGGAGDVHARVLRVASPSAYDDDALRPLRLVRLAAELGLDPEPETERLTLRAAPRVPGSSAERIFGELRRLILAERAPAGLELADRLGLVRAVLPEVDALHGIEQSRFHHLDVYEHTLDVLRQQIDLELRPEAVFRSEGGAVRGVLREPLADELTRGGALRLAALLHDIGKPATRAVRPDGRVTFIGHDAVGERLVGEVCRRLRTSERLLRFVGAITRCHLVLGFLVHERPLSRRAVYRYLKATHPVGVDVTVLTCADRLATRGDRAEPAIASHLELARELAAEALAWRRSGPPRLPLRGDELAGELGIEPGPMLGRLLGGLQEAVFAGEARSREEAVAIGRRLMECENEAR